MDAAIRFGPFELRPAERRLLRDGAQVRLGARAFDLLVALVERRDRLVTKAELLDLVWPGLVVEEANVQVQVSGLRKALGPHTVATVPGLGYRFTGVPGNLADLGEGLSADPLPRSVSSRPPGTNLPVAMDLLIGRGNEFAALVALMDEHPLVTVVGAGGIGKTRLALEVARLQMKHYPDGAWWVDLCALASAEQIAPAIAKAVNVPLGNGDSLAQLARALSSQRLLLVLDNAEHLSGVLPRIVEELLAGCEGLQLLATSREPTRARGEQLMALDPLELPPEGASLEVARSYGALRLLEQRAAEADRRFGLAESTAAQAIDLCRRLDGIPLAIEMAAARLPVLGFQGLQLQLAHRLDRLRKRGHAGLPHQQSLRLTLDWSHSLLNADEQVLLRRLSVFAGNFRLAVVQEAAGFGCLDAPAVLDALAGLVEKSLVKLVQHEPPRYRLLETTRLYAAEKLESSGESQEMDRRHGRALASLAQAARSDFRRPGRTGWFLDYLPDYEDLDLAFVNACERNDADVAAAVVTTLRQLDQMSGLLSSSGRRVPAARALLPRAGGEAQALLHVFIASCGWVCEPAGLRLHSAREAVALWRGLADKLSLHGALAIAATESARVGQHDAAREFLEEAQRLEGVNWPGRAIAVRLVHEGWVAHHRGDVVRYRECLRSAVALWEGAGESVLASGISVMLADAALTAGDANEAVELSRAAIGHFTEEGQINALGYPLSVLSKALLVGGDIAGARKAAERAYPLTPADASHHFLLATCAALLAALDGDARTGALLMGWIEAVVRIDLAPDASRDRLLQVAWAAVESRLEPGEPATLRELGRLFDPEEVDQLMRRSLAARRDAVRTNRANVRVPST